MLDTHTSNWIGLECGSDLLCVCIFLDWFNNFIELIRYGSIVRSFCFLLVCVCASVCIHCFSVEFLLLSLPSCVNGFEVN